MGINLDGLYLRFRIWHHHSGKVDVFVHCYASREAYDENIDNTFAVEGVASHYQYDYDYFANPDLLGFVHDKITQELTTEVTEEKVVIKQKFCELAEIVNELKNDTNNAKH